ncbi:tyrosine-type recombinase/integrase [Archaeoglobus sp.]
MSPNTVFEVKKTLKRFFKWLGKEELVNWFVAGKCESNLSPQDLITHEEFEAMMNACQNPRDRAMLSLLYETGARIGELAAMRIKDVIFDDYGAVIWLPRSKTQRRRLRIVFSTRYLAEWLSDHPLKDDPDAPLWIKLSHKNYLKPLEYKDVQWQLKKIANRAGIKKRIYAHLFRHTRATRLLQQVSEVVGAKYMGWVPGTKMIKTYIHLADQDVERAILEMHGIKPAEDSGDLKVLQCPRCSFVNPSNAKYCSRCGLPLTEEAVREVEEWEERKAKLLEVMTKPEILSLIMSLREEIERLKKLVDERGSDGDPLG